MLAEHLVAAQKASVLDMSTGSMVMGSICAGAGEHHFIIEQGFEMGLFACCLASGALLLIARNISFGVILAGSRNAAVTLSSLVDLSGLGDAGASGRFGRISALML